MAMNAHASERIELVNPLVSFERHSDTLRLDNLELRLDQQLGDEELEVSLLIESLEQQYTDMILEGESDDVMLNLQSAKEWLSGQPERIAGLFQYLKNLSATKDSSIQE